LNEGEEGREGGREGGRDGEKSNFNGGERRRRRKTENRKKKTADMPGGLSWLEFTGREHRDV